MSRRASAGPGATPEENTAVQQAELRAAVDMLAGENVGLIAQDVEAVVPGLVDSDPDGYKRIRYRHLTALLGGSERAAGRHPRARPEQLRETTVREQLEKRVAELQAEHQAGAQMLAEQTPLRISGAVQVLMELLDAETAAG